MPFLGEVPLHMTIREKSDAGLPVVATEPDGAACRRLPRHRRKGAAISCKGGTAGRAAPRIVIEA